MSEAVEGAMHARDDAAKPLKILYFAWLRERMGCAQETIVLPEQVKTVADVMAYLGARDERAAHAFEERASLRAALDLHHVPHTAAIADARELAFFPPVTGG